MSNRVVVNDDFEILISLHNCPLHLVTDFVGTRQRYRAVHFEVNLNEPPLSGLPSSQIMHVEHADVPHGYCPQVIALRLR